MGERTTSVLDVARPGLAGVAEVEQTERGLVPRRMTDRALRTADPVAAAMARTTAGVRLRVLTDAPWLELRCQLTLFPTLVGVQPAVFEATTGGQSLSTASAVEGDVVAVDAATGEASYEGGEEAVVRLGLDPSGPERSYEVWFPPAARVELRDVVVPAPSTLRADPDVRPAWVHHGSSISHCVDAGHPAATWLALAADSLGLSLHNLGLAGQCHLDQLVARSIRDRDCGLITLELGINVVTSDSMRERTFVSAVHGFLDTVRDGHPDTPLVLLTPLACPVVESDPGPTFVTQEGRLARPDRPAALGDGALSLQRVRHLLTTVTATRAASGDRNLHCLDGLDVLGHADVHLLRDGLHPGPEAWPLMGRRFAELVREVRPAPQVVAGARLVR